MLLGLTGLDFITSVSGTASALANIGPGLGRRSDQRAPIRASTIPPSGSSSAAMLLGRLELMAVFVLFTAQFWRG